MCVFVNVPVEGFFVRGVEITCPLESGMKNVPVYKLRGQRKNEHSILCS